MRLPVWSLEWKVALRRRRLFLFNVAIPLLLVLPIKLAGAPSFHASAAYAVLFVLFGTFGSAIPLLRDGESGLLRRMALTGYPEWSFLAERVLAGSVLDLAQLLPALAIILLPDGLDPAGLVIATASLALALVAANLIGVWVAALAGSVAEGALFAAVVALFLLHGSGVFRTPLPGSIGSGFESFLPARPLHEALVGATAGGIPAGAWSNFPLPLAATAVFFLVTIFTSPYLLARTSSPAH